MTRGISIRTAPAADYDTIIAVVDDWWGARSIARCRSCSLTISTTPASSPSGPAANWPDSSSDSVPRLARLHVYPVRGRGAGGAEKRSGRIAVLGVLRDGGEGWPLRRPRGHRAALQRVDRVPRRNGFAVTGPVDGYDSPFSAKVLFQRRLDQLG